MEVKRSLLENMVDTNHFLLDRVSPHSLAKSKSSRPSDSQGSVAAKKVVLIPIQIPILIPIPTVISILDLNVSSIPHNFNNDISRETLPDPPHTVGFNPAVDSNLIPASQVVATPNLYVFLFVFEV